MKKLALFTASALLMASAASAQMLVIGNDEKVTWNDAGAPVFLPPGKDSVTLVDIGTDPANPKIVANLPLMNSVFGPPTNLAIAPDESIALVANSMDWQDDAGKWKPVPDDKLYVIDMKANPPALISTVKVGKQPSGLSINKAGTMALVANRADNSISVLSIKGKEVALIDTVAMGDSVASVVFSPDGKRALAAKFPQHKIAVLDIDGMKVSYTNKADMPVGLWPYNLNITPDGKLGLTADNGANGGSDGHIDTVSVIDMEANPPRVIDRVVVGDAPEGFAISPTGEIAVAIMLKGSFAVPKGAWFANPAGSVVVLKIEGKKLTKIDEIAVGNLPEGAAFSPDGKWLYVGNYVQRTLSILKVDGTKVTDTGKTLALPGQPASLRSRVQ